jgi:excinuclease UvrABC nuclease subunit
MPITGSWWSLTDGMVDSDREEGGVYHLADVQSVIIYVGSADNIKRRMREHVHETENACIAKYATKYQIEYTRTYKARELELYNEFKRANGVPPRCNKIAPSGY